MSFQDSDLSVNDYFDGVDFLDYPKPQPPRIVQISTSTPSTEQLHDYKKSLAKYADLFSMYKARMLDYQKDSKVYSDFLAARKLEFKAYFFDVTGVNPDHPKAQRLLSLCHERGDRPQEVLDLGYDFAELLS
jgi:hypothetical protein